MSKAQLKELQEKMAALEAKFQGQPSTAASSAAPSQVTVKVPRERKLRKFAGSRDDHTIEEWIVDAERATSDHPEAEAVDFILYHLEGADFEEVRLRPSDQRARKKDIFEVLRSAFGEGLNTTQAMRKFFKQRQKEQERLDPNQPPSVTLPYLHKVFHRRSGRL